MSKADNTKRSYRSTFRAVVDHFGANSMPEKGALYAWLAGRVGSGKLMPSSANAMRGHLGQLFRVVRDNHDAYVLNAADFPPFDVKEPKPEALKDPEGTWLKFKAAMPDARVLLYLAVQMFLGLRRSEALGLEWRHVQLGGKRGPELLVEQQRDANKSEPMLHLKHKAPRTRYPIVHPEVLRLLREVSHAFMARTPMYGCDRGALVGDKPCKDKEVRKYIFPYREEHMNQIGRWMKEAAPEEFPKGVRGVRAHKAFHRLRHTFCTSVVRELADTESGRRVAQGLMRHKSIITTDRYSRGALGEGMNREALAAVAQGFQQRAQQREAELLQRLNSSKPRVLTAGGAL